MSEIPHSSFRKRLINREVLVGTWIKTPAPLVCEVLGRTELDALCIDAEHAPFGRLEMDSCIAATRAAGSTPLVRVPSADPHQILNALDCGAAGIVVPHVLSAADAEAICQRSLYGPGGRGFAGSTRVAGFGAKTVDRQLEENADTTAIIAQIEDLPALDAVEEIAAVERVDCLFIGRMDLTIAFGKTDPSDPLVVEAVEKICSVCRRAGKAVGMFVSDIDETGHWKDRGASLFLLASDHAFLMSGARNLAAAVR